MDKNRSVPEQLKLLIEQYDFNIETLSKYLRISTEQVKHITQGTIDILPNENSFRFQVFTKIQLLYDATTEDKDSKLSAYLKVLLSYHNVSQKTISKMSGAEVCDIKKLLSNPPEEIGIDTKYRIAVTVMSLRFSLKDNEPPIQ